MCALRRGKPTETSTPFQTYLETAGGWYAPIIDEIDRRHKKRDTFTGGRLNSWENSMDIESGEKLHEPEDGQLLNDNYSVRGARLGPEDERERPSINSSSETLLDSERQHNLERLEDSERDGDSIVPEDIEQHEILEGHESFDQPDNSEQSDNFRHHDNLEHEGEEK